MLALNTARFIVQKVGTIALFASCPFVVLYWMVPFATHWTIGNDYPWAHLQQIETQFALRSGTFPLYFPGVDIGVPGGGLTLGQLFHPVAYLAVLLPGYWDGHALSWATLVRFFTLALSQLFVYRVWRALWFPPGQAFLLSFLAVYNFRMLDSFRYNASLEAYTGLLFLFSSLVFYLLKPGRAVLPLAIVGSTYWILCCGVPQWSYFALGANILILAFLPFFLPLLRSDLRQYRPMFLRRAVSALAYIATGVALSAIYVVPFYFDFVLDNPMRHHASYSWTTGFSDTVWGGISAWFDSYQSDVHGAFGGTSLFLVGLLAALFMAREWHVPRAIRLVGWISLLVFIISLGAATPAHRLAYHLIPFFSDFRVPGRINLLLPLFMVMAIAWFFRACDGNPESERNKAVWLLALTLYTIYCIALLYLQPSRPTFAPLQINVIPTSAQNIALLGGAITLMAFTTALTSNRAAVAKISLVLGVMLVVAHTTLLLRYGTWIQDTQSPTYQKWARAKSEPITVPYKPSPTFEEWARAKSESITAPYKPSPTFEEYARAKSESITVPYKPGSGMMSSAVKDYRDRIPKEDRETRLAWISHWVEPVGSASDAFDRINHGFDTRHSVALEDESGDGDQPFSKLADKDAVSLSYNSYNRFILDATTRSPGVLVFAQPFSKQWFATIDNSPAPIARANGLFQAVKIPAGSHRVELRYFSTAAAVGTFITLLTLALFGAHLIFQTQRSTIWRVTSTGLLILGCCMLGVFWHHSLYHGANLGTVYHWRSEEASAERVN